VYKNLNTRLTSNIILYLIIIMFDIFLLFSFIGTTLAQFRPPVLTVAPAPTVPVFTIGSIAPVRTIRTTIENITTTLSTTLPLSTTFTTPSSTTSTTFTIPSSTTVSNTFTQTEEINQNLFFVIIPSGLLLLFFIYSCLKKRKRNVNVVNIDLNIENKIPKQEPERQISNLSNHFYEEIDYEARYEMPDIKNVKYENVIQENVKYENVVQENEYGKQVTTCV
jgi:hypothetical protein